MYKHKTLAEKTEECKELLRSTKRPDIEKLIDHIVRMGYFVAPGSKKHHRFEGGLVSHSLETYHKAMQLRDEKISQGVSPDLLPQESITIAALMHDLCKADAIRYNAVSRTVYTVRRTSGHSARSVRQVGYSGFQLTDAEKDAILWHMGGKHFSEPRAHHFANHPLSEIIFWADKRSIGEARKRLYGKRKV